MPTFRMKNLSVTLGEAAQLATPQLTPHLCPFPTQFCVFPTQQCWPFSNCHQIVSLCAFPTRCHLQTLVTCLAPTDYCYTPTPLTCWTVSPDTCGALSPVCDFSMTPTIVETIKTTTVIIAQASERELEALRADLDKVIAIAHERGTQVGSEGRPRTMEEVEMLEKELRAALDEVQQMKKDMK